jgi:TolB-like protein
MLYRFGTFEFDRGSGELRKNGRAVALEPQAKASRPGEPATWCREELRDAVGIDTHVDSIAASPTASRRSGRAVCWREPRLCGPSRDVVSALSPRLLSHRNRVQRFQGSTGSTGSKGGVRIAVVAAVVAALAIGWVLGRPRADAQVVVAVSVFDNETGLAEHDRLVAGLSDLVIERLTKIAPDRIAVVGNAAVLRPRSPELKAVKENVQAHYALLGQLQRGESGLRFITHVIRLDDEAHLKANRLVMPDGGVGGLEDAVAAEFERAVRIHVLERTAN